MSDLIVLPGTGAVDLRIGNCLEVLQKLPEKHFHTCVTSPPYFGLRDYGHDGQIGLEETPDEYVAQMVNVFREVRRVLRDDGTLWLNLGDSYVMNPSTSTIPRSKQGNGSGVFCLPDDDDMMERRMSSRANAATALIRTGLKKKDLIGIPWRVAFALQADGWYLRQDIIWHKPNPMPESVTDRCTKAHEYVFLLSKSAKYYYDADAIREPHLSSNPDIPWRERTYGGTSGIGELNGDGSYKRGTSRQPCGNHPLGKNKRSVWTVNTKPFKGAHFATYPPDLIKPCILAGCPKEGQVLDPIGGSGTTGMVAADLGRKATIIELNPDYEDIIKTRLEHRLQL